MINMKKTITESIDNKNRNTLCQIFNNLDKMKKSLEIQLNKPDTMRQSLNCSLSINMYIKKFNL